MAKFKFLAGEHIGAVLNLPQGTHTLGNAPDCLLQTGGLEDGAETVALLVSVSPADEISVTLQQGKAVLDGKNLSTGTAVPWALGQILSFGFTALAPYKEGMDLAAVDLSVLGFTRAAAEEQAKAPAEPAKQSAAEPAAVPAPQAAPLETETAAGPEAQVKTSPARIVWLIAGLVVLALLLSSLVAGSYLYGSRADERALLSSAEEYVQHSGFDGVKAQFDGRSIVFSGILPNRAALSQFINGLPALSCSVIFDLSLADDELKALEDAFAVQGAAVRASIGIDGRIKVSGYVKDPYVERALLERVLPSFAVLPEPEFDFHYAPELVDALEQGAAAAALELSFEPGDYTLVYDGPMTYPESQKLAALRQELEQKFAMPLRLLDKQSAGRGLISHLNARNAVIAGNTAPGAQSPSGAARTFSAGEAGLAEGNAGAGLTRFDPGRVVGVTMQPLRFITMDSGEKFFEGALLPGGAVLKEIHLDYLVVEHHGRSTSYELK